MKYCRRCGKPFHERFDSCPHCAERKAGKYVRTTPAPARRRRKKKTNWLPMILLLAILIAVVAVICSFCSSSDETTQDQAGIAIDEIAQQSVADLKALLNNVPNLSAVKEKAMQQLNSGESTIEISMSGESGLVKDMTFRLNTSRAAEMINGALEMGLAGDENESRFRINIAMAKDILQIAAPELLDDVLQADLTSDELSMGDDIGGIMQLQELLSNHDFIETVDKMLKGIVANKPVQETIRFGEENRKCTVYTLDLDEKLAEKFEQFYEATMKTSDVASEETIATNFEQFRVVIHNEKLVGLIAQGDGSSAQFLLCGEENPWSNISVTVDGAEKLTITLIVTAKGLEICLLKLQDASQTWIVCDDQAQTVSVVGEDDATIRYGIEGEKIVLSLRSESKNMTMDIVVDALAEEPKMLSETAADLNSLDQNTLYMLLSEAIGNIQADPETAWIYSYLISTMAG